MIATLPNTLSFLRLYLEYDYRWVRLLNNMLIRGQLYGLPCK
jgi:hypothetical protein